jgi:predicted acylesterase/phospholipase RssA
MLKRKRPVRPLLRLIRVKCQPSTKQLDNPEDPANRLSDEERDALKKMRQFVSGEYPHAIVMKGGGVKGLAFAGALLELERHFWFNQHVGASAGAIAAILLAADYKPKELADILREKNFKDFVDAPFWKVPINLLIRGGCYPGEAFRLWLAQLLAAKKNLLSEISMSDLNGALIYASRRGGGIVRFDSRGERKETPAAFAARCSMSIPYYFQPMSVDGRPTYDGGIRNNFPLKQYIEDYPSAHFIGLYLGRPDNRAKLWSVSELLEIVTEGDERSVVDKHQRDVVVIDPSPITAADFSLSPIEKEFLLSVGKAAALRFLWSRKLDDGPSESDVHAGERRAEELREDVISLRWQKRKLRILFVAIILTVTAIGYFVKSAM